ncbi:hypothetical protein AVEN_140872-1 [Araneus ventricosus]|uniref:Uncharacterized protein n=1 Tax=Araneus ventricosus TaxID=182803 RepID=A0A4Y2U719_ARAVE|nr:hypothetical protein AVEN_140872-1 [Araneus ventricosus]
MDTDLFISELDGALQEQTPACLILSECKGSDNCAAYICTDCYLPFVCATTRRLCDVKCVTDFRIWESAKCCHLLDVEVDGIDVIFGAAI